jgi:hypothetical protein
MSKPQLRAYFVHSKWEATGQAIVAKTAREARQYFDTSDDDCEFTDVRARWIRDANTDGLEEGAVRDYIDALRRKMYSFIENGKCDVCGKVGYAEEYKGKVVCEDCLETI